MRYIFSYILLLFWCFIDKNNQTKPVKPPPFSCYRITYIGKYLGKKKGKNGKAQEQRLKWDLILLILFYLKLQGDLFSIAYKGM